MRKKCFNLILKNKLKLNSEKINQNYGKSFFQKDQTNPQKILNHIIETLTQENKKNYQQYHLNKKATTEINCVIWKICFIKFYTNI